MTKYLSKKYLSNALCRTFKIGKCLWSNKDTLI